MKKVFVQFNFQIPVEIKQKGKWFIANCPVLDVVTQGKTLEQAKHNLGEALSLFLFSCYERGTLDSVMRNCGFSPAISNKFQDEQHQPQEYINVPLPFMIDMKKNAQCHRV
jgi:predicted RNase H-like HicB family nuclease